MNNNKINFDFFEVDMNDYKVFMKKLDEILKALDRLILEITEEIGE